MDLKGLLDAAKNASPRTKMVAVLALIAVGVALWISGLVAAQPNFVLLYSGLDDNSRAAVEKAMAGGAIRYKVSQPPGPYVVYVDEPQQYAAQNLVALSGALKEMPRGIDSTTTGASSIFLSAGERLQSMLKRDWQEMERQLETLEFVSSASVTTSMPDPSPIGEHKAPTVSVTLGLKGLTELSREQSDNVAKLVRFRFNVPAENVIISDQSGRTLCDPSRTQNMGTDPASLLEFSANYDHEQEAKINRQLAAAYGEKKALVTLTSEWDHDQTTTVDEKIGKGIVVSEKKNSTETPQGSSNPATGGAAGSSSNIAQDQGFGVDNAGQPGANPTSSVAKATSNEDEKTYAPSRTKTQTVHATPVLKHLSVSLLLDDSLAAKKDEIASIVQAAVGFSKERNDVIEVGTTAFASDAKDSKDAKDSPKPAPGGGGMSPLVEMLIKRAIEIVAAIAFLLVLFKTLKGSKGAMASASVGASVGGSSELGASAGAGAQEGEPDPELLARARIEDLVRTDPRRVGEILSRWASEGRAARAGQ